jgi:ribose transport system permease protein
MSGVAMNRTGVEPVDTSIRKPLLRLVFSADRWGPYGMVLLVAFELVLFSVWAPETFPTAVNFRAVIANQVILGLLVLAMLVPLIAGELDASLPAVLTVTSLISASLISSQGWPLIASIAASMLLATLIGLVNGLVVVKIGVSSLVTTLGTFTILTGLITGLAGGRTITDGLPKATLKRFADPRLLGLPLPVYYLAVVAFVVWYVTERTPLGRHWQAVGSCEPAARMAGLRTDRLRVLAFTAGGFLAGIAGVVQLVKAQPAVSCVCGSVLGSNSVSAGQVQRTRRPVVDSAAFFRSRRPDHGRCPLLG